MQNVTVKHVRITIHPVAIAGDPWFVLNKTLMVHFKVLLPGHSALNHFLSYQSWHICNGSHAVVVPDEFHLFSYINHIQGYGRKVTLRGLHHKMNLALQIIIKPRWKSTDKLSISLPANTFEHLFCS